MKIVTILLLILYELLGSSFLLGETQIPPFEKVYIKPHQLVSKPDGLYCFDEYGDSFKVKTVLGDEDGMYLVVVKFQCPLCGRIHTNKTPDEPYGCPIFLKQVMPTIWIK